MDDIEKLEEKNDELRKKLNKLIEKRNKLINERQITKNIISPTTYPTSSI